MENYTINQDKKIITINDLSKVTPKKISGTNFGVVLGVNTYSTPFQAWCDMMRVYKKPFVETLETKAGKEIEGRQAKYIKEKYNLVGLTSPEDKFGSNYFNRTRGDFFPMEDYFQGMWDFINVDPRTDKITSVIEMKTTKEKNYEKWSREVPPYYMLQVGLYAYLLKVEKFVVVASFLKDEDYLEPLKFVPNEQNTKIMPYTMSKKFPKFYEYYIMPAKKWWNDYIVTGVSPMYDEYNAGDVEIVKELLKKQQEEQEAKEKAISGYRLKDIKGDECPFY